MCVCLSATISPEPPVLSLAYFSCMLPIVVAWSSSDRVTKSQGGVALLEVFFPTGTVLYSIAFGIHAKTAEEQIEMPFGMMTRVGLMYHVLDGGPDPQGEGAILGVSSPLTLHCTA